MVHFQPNKLFIISVLVAIYCSLQSVLSFHNQSLNELLEIKNLNVIELHNEANRLTNILLEKEEMIQQLKENLISLEPSSGPKKGFTSLESVEKRLQHLEEVTKVSSLRSCKEYEEYGIVKSGTYTIDPDDPLMGDPPFNVYCDFDSHTTEVLHSKEGETNEIEHCSGHMCYHLELNYNTTMQQIVSLIDLSESCSQHINFDCFLAPLSTNFQPIGQWVNRNGFNETYFTGSNSGNHVCECGIHGSCSGAARNLTCNCDAADLPVVQNDSGEITDMAALPITGFYYDDV